MESMNSKRFRDFVYANRWIILILLLAIFLRFFNLQQRGAYNWDEGEYLDAAESVLEGKYLWIGVALKPLHNFLIMVSFLLFGNHDYVGIGVSAFTGVLTVYLVYLIGRKLFDEKIGLFAALILAVTEYHLYYSRSALADGNLTFFFVLTMFFYVHSLLNGEKKYHVLTGIGVGLCFLTKNTGALVLPVILLSEFFMICKYKEFKKERFINTLLILAISSAFILTTISAYRYFGSLFLVEYAELKSTGRLISILTISTYLKTTDYGFYLVKMKDMVSIPALLLGLLGLFIGLKNREKGDVLCITWFLFLFTFFTAFPLHRYKIFVPAIPAFSLIAARSATIFKARWIEAILILLLLVGGLAQSWDTLIFKSPGYRESAEFIRMDNGKGVISANLGIYQYYADEDPLPVYFMAYIRNKDDFIYLYEEGYTHIVFDPVYLANAWPLHKEYNGVKRSKIYESRLALRDQILDNIEPAFVVESNFLKDPTVMGRDVGEPAFKEVLKKDPKNFNIYVFRLSDIVNNLDKIELETPLNIM